jgi:hypothetical protein
MRIYLMEKFQARASCNSMHVEFIACNEALGHVMWLKKFIPDLRIVDCIRKPLRLCCDIAPAVFYAHNNKSTNATKRIEVRNQVEKYLGPCVMSD